MKGCITDEMFQVLDKTISVALLLFDREKLLYYNEACRRMFGYGEEGEKDPGHRKYRLEDLPVDRKIIDAIWKKAADAKDSVVDEFTTEKKDGTAIIIECSCKLVSYEEEPCVLAQLYDITEKKRIETNLMHLSKVRALMLEISQSVVEAEDINEIYDLILKNALNSIENADLGSIFILDRDVFRIVAYNGFSSEIEDFELPKEESTLYRMTAGRMDEIKYVEDISKYDRFYPVNTKFEGERLIKSTITTPIFVNGGVFGMINIDSLHTNKFTDDDIKTMQFIQNSVEIAISNHLLYEKARYLSRYDCLTNLYNRSYFNEAFARIKREYKKKGEVFFVVIMDLNGLKQINDQYGHLCGDRAIRTAADAIRETLRGKDFVSRIGGDEFCGLYFETAKDELSQRMKTCIAKLKEMPAPPNESETVLSFSFGISTFPEDGTDFKELGRIADERMYRFKKAYKEEMKKKEEHVAQ